MHTESHSQNKKERIFDMDKKQYILPDSEILELSEYAPMTEGGTLEELLEETEQVAVAIKRTGEDLSGLDEKAKALFYMRAFYFLGVLRGGEAYRVSLLLGDDINTEEPPQITFELSGNCAELFVDDLRVQSKPSKTLKTVYKALGLGE